MKRLNKNSYGKGKSEQGQLLAGNQLKNDNSEKLKPEREQFWKNNLKMMVPERKHLRRTNTNRNNLKKDDSEKDKSEKDKSEKRTLRER